MSCKLDLLFHVTHGYPFHTSRLLTMICVFLARHTRSSRHVPLLYLGESVVWIHALMVMTMVPRGVPLWAAMTARITKHKSCSIDMYLDKNMNIYPT
jgi:hypothetical protein